VPNKGHVDVFIYHVLLFRTWQSKMWERYWTGYQ